MPASFDPIAMAGGPRGAVASTAAASAAPGAARALSWSAAAWCSVALAGQLLFAAYVVAFYGRAALAGQPQRWNRVLPHGWVAGDAAANLLVGLHLLFTVLIIAGALVQLLPPVRRLAPAVHRWNGRAYVFSALVMAGGGLWMLATRRTVGDASQHAALAFNAVLIIVFASMAWHHAHARRFDAHRRWALRLFLAVSGVWFFRVGLMAWIVTNQGPAGFDPNTFEGPFLTFLGFAQYLIPLLLLEAYLRARDGGRPHMRLAVAAALGGATLLTTVGIGAAAMVMWLPRMGA